MSNIKDFVIENGVLKKYRGNDAEVVVPDNVTVIGFSAFRWCRDLTSVTIPDSVTVIGNGTFEGCENLKSITISDSVTHIGDYAFLGCKKLKSIAIPEGVTEIGCEAFYGCESLASVTIPDSVTKIGYSAFRGCDGLKNSDGFIIVRDVLYGYTGDAAAVTIPNGVTAIGISAFGGCEKLVSVTIPDSVTKIEYWALQRCINLAQITIPASVISIGWEAFSGCKRLNAYISGKPKIEKNAFCDVACIIAPQNSPSDFITPNERNLAAISFLLNRSLFVNTDIVKEYEEYILGHRKKLLPEFLKGDNVEAIAFYENKNKITLKNFQTDFFEPAEKAQAKNCITYLLNWKNKNIKPEDIEKEFEKEFTKDSYNAADMKKIWSYEVTADGSICITGYKGTETEVYIPERIGNKIVTSIGTAFAPESATGKPKPKATREALQKIIAVYIPDGVKKIGDNAFLKCTNLMSVTIPDSVKKIGKDAFSGCDSLKNADGFIIIRDVLYGYKGDATAVTIPDGVTVIGNGAFSECEKLAAVTIPEGVKKIGDNAFWKCTNLTSVIIPDGVTIIGNCAFYGCKSLMSMTIPDSVIKIGSGAFEGRENLIPSRTPKGDKKIKTWIIDGYIKFTIRAAEGSFAEKYAKLKNIPFVAE